MRCRHEIESTRGAKSEGRESIVFTSIPYQVGKSALVEKIAEAAKDKRIEASPTSATKARAKACAWSLISSATPRPRWC